MDDILKGTSDSLYRSVVSNGEHFQSAEVFYVNVVELTTQHRDRNALFGVRGSPSFDVDYAAFMSRNGALFLEKQIWVSYKLNCMMFDSVCWRENRRGFGTCQLVAEALLSSLSTNEVARGCQLDQDVTMSSCNKSFVSVCVEAILGVLFIYILIYVYVGYLAI